jgi:hypothetical protein
MFLHKKAENNRTYYVSYANGLDTNNGTSSLSPWKTITKINSSKFKPGDRILLNRGETWSGVQLTMPSSGKPGNPIYFGAYGSGVNPILDLSVVYTDWVSYDAPTYTYRRLGNADETQVFQGATRLYKRTSINNVKSNAGSWYAAATNYVYVHCTDSGDPNTKSVTNTLYDNAWCIDINGKSYITIDGIDIQRAKKSGITTTTVANAGVTGITYMNATASWNGERGVRFCGNYHGDISGCVVENIIGHDNIIENFWINGFDTLMENCESYNNGKEYNNGYVDISAGLIAGEWSNGVVVRNCNIHDGYNFGLMWVEWEGTTGARPTNVLVEKNVFTNTQVSNGDVIFLHGDSTCRFQNNTINATLVGTSYSHPIIQVENGAIATKVYNNTIVVQSGTNPNIAINVEGAGADIFNNIIVHLGTGENGKIGFAADRTASTVGYNQYYSVGDGWWQYQGTDVYELATWQSDSGDSHDAVTDPKLVNTTSDFHLQSSSPCRSAGLATLGVLYDKGGVPRPTNDMGAFQYVT